MRGKITRIVPKTETAPGKFSGGFGFIRDEEGQDRFFHANDLVSGETGGVAVGLLDRLRQGDLVTFEPTAGNQSRSGKGTGNGLRAIKVRLG